MDNFDMKSSYVGEQFEASYKLSEAADKGDFEQARLAIKAGAVLEYKREIIRKKLKIDKKLRTPLLLAVNRGYIDIVKLLIEAGASVEAIDAEGNTALSLAIDKDYTDIEKMLFNVMSEKQINNEIVLHANTIDIQFCYDKFTQAVHSDKQKSEHCFELATTFESIYVPYLSHYAQYTKTEEDCTEKLLEAKSESNTNSPRKNLKYG